MRALMAPVAEDWGKNVQKRRAELGLTQSQLAGLCEVTQQTISKIEAGIVVPRDGLKLAIAHKLATTVDLLFPWPKRAAS